MTLTHKKNHFVPRVYLKEWTHNDKGNIGIYTLNLRDKRPRIQGTKEIANKKNLYTLPLTFPDETRKVSEKIIYKIWEDRWPNVLKGIKENIQLDKEQIRQLVSYVITQSFRTPKFARENQEIIRKTNDPEFLKTHDTVMFAFLGIVGYTSYVENATCEILYTNEIHNFICSDNPATHWLVQGNSFTYIKGTALRQDLSQNDNYKIICPITPKHLAIVTPNIGKKMSESTKISLTKRLINSELVKFFNTLIENGADKLLFAKHLTDFI